MAPTLAELRKQAKEAGLPATLIRSAESAAELQEMISDHVSDHLPKGKPAKKTATKKTVAKKTTVRKPARKPATVKKSAVSKSKPATTKSAPRKAATTGKAKRSTAAKATKRNSTYEPKGGRNLLESVDFSETDGWNPREGSAPDRIIRALKKARGNREKAFDLLVGDIWDFVGRTRPNGEKHTKASAEKMLRYRISRTLWDFAMRTGQHEKAENRVEYGTGGTGEGVFKRAKSTTRKTAPKQAPRKRGRPPKAQATPKKTPARRGRPPKTATARKVGKAAARRR